MSIISQLQKAKKVSTNVSNSNICLEACPTRLHTALAFATVTLGGATYHHAMGRGIWGSEVKWFWLQLHLAASVWPSWDSNQKSGSRVHASLPTMTHGCEFFCAVTCTIFISRWKPPIPRLAQELITPFPAEANPCQPRGFSYFTAELTGTFQEYVNRRVRGRKELGNSWGRATAPYSGLLFGLQDPIFSGGGTCCPLATTSISLGQQTQGGVIPPKRCF